MSTSGDSDPEPMEDCGAGSIAVHAQAGSTDSDPAIAREIDELLTRLEAKVEAACAALAGAGRQPSGACLSMRWRGEGARARLPKSSWAIVRHFFAQERMPAKTIAAFFGISPAAIWQRAKRERWLDEYQMEYMDPAAMLICDAAQHANLLLAVESADEIAAHGGARPRRAAKPARPQIAKRDAGPSLG